MTLVSESPVNATQKAMFTILGADAALIALIGSTGIHDQPPEGEVYPYIRIGDHLSIPDNDLTSFGREMTETLHIWSRTRSNATGQAIARRVNELLDHQAAAMTVALAGSGHRCVSIRNEFDQALTDPDPQIRHHVLRYRIITAQVS